MTASVEGTGGLTYMSWTAWQMTYEPWTFKDRSPFPRFVWFPRVESLVISATKRKARILCRVRDVWYAARGVERWDNLW